MNNTGIFCSSVSVFEAMAAYDTGFPFSVVCVSSFPPFCPDGSILVSHRCLSSVHPLPSNCPNPPKWHTVAFCSDSFLAPRSCSLVSSAYRLMTYPSPQTCHLTYWLTYDVIFGLLANTCPVFWKLPLPAVSSGLAETIPISPWMQEKLRPCPLTSSPPPPSILSDKWTARIDSTFYSLDEPWNLLPPLCMNPFCCLGSDPILLSGAPVLTSSSSLPVSDLPLCNQPLIRCHNMHRVPWVPHSLTLDFKGLPTQSVDAELLAVLRPEDADENSS